MSKMGVKELDELAARRVMSDVDETVPGASAFLGLEEKTYIQSATPWYPTFQIRTAVELLNFSGSTIEPGSGGRIGYRL